MSNQYTDLNENHSLDIIKMYLDNSSMENIAQTLGIGHSSVSKILEYHRIPARGANDLTKIVMKEDFFEKIDTEEKAYFLGWMFADGNVNKEIKTASLTVLKKDSKIMKKLSSMISDGNTCYSEYRNYSVVRMCRKKMCEDLVKLGCVPNKSLVLKFPDLIPDNLIPHFLRGYCDGDGSFYFVRGPIVSYHAKIASTKTFCLRMGEILKSFNPKIGFSIEEINDKGTAAIKFAGLNPIRLGHFLYKDASFFLERKYEKFMSMIDLQNNRVYTNQKKWMQKYHTDVAEIVKYHLALDKRSNQ